MINLHNIALTAITIATTVLLNGCDSPEMPQDTKTAKISVSYGVNIFCDKEVGIEYLVFKEYRAGGITLRLNEDGKPKRCGKSVKWVD